MGAFLLIGITAAAFAPVLGHHFIESWDDTQAILTNPDYNPPTFAKLAHYWVPPPKDTFYVPVTYTLWGVLAMLSQSSAPPGIPFNPAFFYAANLASHAISAALVFLILLQLVRISQAGGSKWQRAPALLAAWLGAAVFALHPVQVEGVATASSVYTPLSGMFGFLAIWQYLSYSDQLHGSAARRRAWFHYALATLAFLTALLTKPTAVAVPLVICVIELTLRNRRALSVALSLAPWLVLSVGIILLNEHSSPAATVFVPEPQFRALVPLDAIGFYASKVVAPLHLVSDYGRSPRWLMNHPGAWLTCLVPLAMFAIAWRFRDRVPQALGAVGVFVAGLLPSIGIVPFDFQHYSTVADRYMYIALLGPAVAVGFLVARFGRIAAAITIAALGVLAALSVVQLSHWRDDWRLMAYTLDVNPQSLSATIGFRYLLTGVHDTHHFPAPRACTLDQTELVRVGDLLMSRRFWPVAAAAYRRALARGTPSAAIYDRLGEAELRDIEPRQAAEAFSAALRLDPRDPQARRGVDRAAAMVVQDVSSISLPSSAPSNSR